MTRFYQQPCSTCKHQRQLHEFPRHNQFQRGDGVWAVPWKRESGDPGCRIGHPKYMKPIADGVFTIPHQGDPCPCKEFKE